MNGDNPYQPPAERSTPSRAIVPGGTTIRLARYSKYPDRLRAYRVVIDGEFVGKIRVGETVAFPVRPGPHTVVATIDWCSSETVECNASEGDIVDLEVANNCRGFRFPLLFLYSLILRDRYLSLERR